MPEAPFPSSAISRTRSQVFIRSGKYIILAIGSVLNFGLGADMWDRRLLTAGSAWCKSFLPDLNESNRPTSYSCWVNDVIANDLLAVAQLDVAYLKD
ncbi:hypothetical protein PGTUg99_025986 [Puccinia graminis f. sp. tritici]|uniref:Uncharacterized protein n=1 Tax=Puccinia graminis f. sp. tritici TaxID=56615 RepID=A0A5B0REL8_PUCGR|nr:hypothetical protein PGTUg99_025986 [Puccinia graminis f. sp. tritici]